MVLLVHGDKGNERWFDVYVEYKLKDRVYFKTKRWEDMWLEVEVRLNPVDFGLSPHIVMLKVKPAPGSVGIFRTEFTNWVPLELFSEELLVGVR